MLSPKGRIWKNSHGQVWCKGKNCLHVQVVGRLLGVEKLTADLPSLYYSLFASIPVSHGFGIDALLSCCWSDINSLCQCIATRLKFRTSLDLFWHLQQLFIKLVNKPLSCHGSNRNTKRVSKEQWNKCKHEVLACILNFSSSKSSVNTRKQILATPLWFRGITIPHYAWGFWNREVK